MGEHSMSHEFMELKKRYLEQLTILNYSSGSIRNSLCVFYHLEKFLEKQKDANYNKEVGKAFLDEMARGSCAYGERRARLPWHLNRLISLVDVIPFWLPVDRL